MMMLWMLRGLIVSAQLAKGRFDDDNAATAPTISAGNCQPLQEKLQKKAKSMSFKGANGIKYISFIDEECDNISKRFYTVKVAGSNRNI